MVMKLKGKAKRISLMSKRSNKKKGCKTEKVIARNFGSFSRQMKVDKKPQCYVFTSFSRQMKVVKKPLRCVFTSFSRQMKVVNKPLCFHDFFQLLVLYGTSRIQQNFLPFLTNGLLVLMICICLMDRKRKANIGFCCCPKVVLLSQKATLFVHN